MKRISSQNVSLLLLSNLRTQEATTYLHNTLGNSGSSSSKFIGFSFYETEWYFSHKDQRITSMWKSKFKAQIFQIFVVTPEEITSNVKILLHLHFTTSSKCLIEAQNLAQTFKAVLLFLHLYACVWDFVIKFLFSITLVPPIRGFTIQDFKYL